MESGVERGFVSKKKTDREKNDMLYYNLLAYKVEVIVKRLMLIANLVSTVVVNCSSSSVDDMILARSTAFDDH